MTTTHNPFTEAEQARWKSINDRKSTLRRLIEAQAECEEVFGHDIDGDGNVTKSLDVEVPLIGVRAELSELIEACEAAAQRIAREAISRDSEIHSADIGGVQLTVAAPNASLQFTIELVATVNL